MLVTIGFISLFTFHGPTAKWVRVHPEMFWIAFVIMLVTLIAMACCTNVRRKAPMNFIFLTLFTFAQSFLLGISASRFDTEAVINLIINFLIVKHCLKLNI